ncbi:fatty acyl-CoA reductase 1 [Tribolium castaneum]|uniref:Fatty acyl-CoA reductase n=1 Tax=Tribolium castaneum TaxID=7070 RepID=D2A4M2_TRICA|nr:PREDICTED: fatty acyl-CoA reductase 1 [Tribolium castaneum]EFA05205.1 Putative fatty acyl-CoA reductase CG5065-like Protein [Tribolium castaneum]|eukprot:XP_970251.1 PREDICTED: fatty acyl-CoA reductase 1 [Tribolium castaneum]
MSETNRISQLFKDQNILITGATGFLGKVLVEKFLRCTEVKKLYLLVRSKKGKNPQERLDELYSNMLFDVLKRENPSVLKKCLIIPGDITQEGLGISTPNRILLQEEIDFIFHSAASTRFDDSVKTAVKINTRSTKYVLDLAQECKNLKLLVHVSTAYAFPNVKVLHEKSYNPPKNPHEVLEMIKFGKDDDIEELLGDAPNTYTFSKALAEALVVEKMGIVPSIIVRPSIVCPTLAEPIPGWVNNLQGPMGLFVGAGKGIIRSMYMQGDSYADFVPADVTINGMLSASWYYLSHDQNAQFYNITSSSQYNFTWEELITTGKSVIFNEVPFNGVVWYPGGSIKTVRWVHELCFYLFQLLPAILIDVILVLLRYKPVLYQIQRRIQKGNEVFEYYTNRAWDFSNRRANDVKGIMNEIERKVYKIDGEGFDLKDYLTKCMWCLRRNNLKESDETVPAARRHMKVMWAVDIVVKILFLVVLLYYGYQWYQTLTRTILRY